MTREEFGRYMRSAREKTGLSKFSAGKALGYQSDGTINALEQGRMPLPVDLIHPIARLYDLKIGELLQIIQESEPRLFRRYQKLYRDIVGDFTTSVVAQRSSASEASKARHHVAFANELFNELTGIYLIRTKSMVQMNLNLRERSLHDKNQKVLVFAHARQRRTQGFHSHRNLHRHQLRAAA